MLGRICRATLVVAAVLGIAGCGAHAAARPIYAQVRFRTAGAPVIYLRFDRDECYMATSAEGLKTAKPLAHAGEGRSEEAAAYAPVDLPAKAKGITKVTVGLAAQRNPHSPESKTTCVNGQFTVERRDQSGTVWEYHYCAGGEAKGATSPEEACVITIPSWTSYTLGIEPKVEGGKVGLGLRVKADGQKMWEVKRAGKPAAARLEVLDEKGKVIAKATGDLAKFGFT